MGKIRYEQHGFTAERNKLIVQADKILTEYAADGYTLTIRQLYYQLVSGNVIKNVPQEYKSLVDLMTKARLAGLIDWEAIEDRTRNVQIPTTWENLPQILEAAYRGYKENPWEKQENYVEVWVEKEALSNVLDRACDDFRVPWFCCKGYPSLSEMWRTSLRLLRQAHPSNGGSGKQVTILYLGDHDPSGIDMVRNLRDRLKLLTYELDMDIMRIALNMAQIEEYALPPNPAKETDSRSPGYVEKYGNESWELDALKPQLLVDLIQDNLRGLIDNEAWGMSAVEEADAKKQLRGIINAAKLSA